MDPIFMVGAAGGALAIVGGLEYAGFKINQAAVTFIMEITKYGAILWLLKSMAVLL